MFMYDEDLGWKFIPDKQGTIIYPGEAYNRIRTNSSGFRDKPITDGSSSKKILVLGDSFVSNISVKDDEVFTEVMEARLPGYAVLNFGVNAYGQVQEYLVQKEWLQKLRPDVLMVMIYIRNDFTDNTGERDWIYSRPYASLSTEGELQISPAPPPKKSSGKKSGWLKDLHLYHFVKTRVRAVKENFSSNNGEHIKPAFTPPELQLCDTQPDSDMRLKYQIMERLLEKISDHAKSSGVPVVFAIAPSIVQVEDQFWDSWVLKRVKEKTKYRRSYPNEVLLQIAEKHKLNMVDLLPVLSEETQRGKKLYNLREQHWNAEGNKVVARALMKYLKEGDLIEP